MISTIALYLLVSIYFIIVLEHENGKQWPVVMLSIFWPVFVVMTIIQAFTNDDDDENTA